MKKLILLLAFFVFSCGTSSPDKGDAKQAGRAALLQNMKNPMGVTFFQNDNVKIISENVFEYTETISATNSFGGTITQNAIIKIKWLQDDPSEVTNWAVLDLKLLDR